MTVGDLVAIFLPIISLIILCVRIHDNCKTNSKDIAELKKKEACYNNRLSKWESKTAEIDDLKHAINIVARALSALMEKELTGSTEALKIAKSELDKEKGII